MRKDDKLLGKTMKKLYLEGFRSKSPIGNVETDMELIQLFNNSLVEREFREDEVDDETLRVELEEETLIADPVLSAFVNQENEIVVNDSLYKFTRVGVFSSRLKDRSKLFSYLEKLNQNLSEEEILQLRKNSSGNMLVVEGIKRYVAPLSDEILQQNLIKRTPEVDLQPVIDGLPITAGGKNWILQRVFGESVVSEEYFDRRRRAKVEFWNQDYGFYKSTGISVRNQTRRFRVWWASDADEVALGINHIKMKYTMPKAPVPGPFSPASNLDKYNEQARPITYTYKGNLYHFQNGFPVQSKVTVEDIGLPFFNIDRDEPILNVYIPRIPIINRSIDYTLRWGDVLTDSNIRTIYKEAFNVMKQITPHKKEMVIFKEVGSHEIEAYYFGERHQETNTNKIKRTLKNDYGFLISWSKKSGFSLPKPSEMQSFTAKEVDFFGMVRRGNTWKGARIRFSK